MYLGRYVQDRLHCSNLIKSGFVAMKNLFLETTTRNTSRANKARYTAVFEVLENREVFASTPFLFSEMETSAVLESPIEIQSHQAVIPTKMVHRTGSVEVLFFDFELTMDRTKHYPNPQTNPIEANKPRLDSSGLVGEGESAPFHRNLEPNVSLSNQTKFPSPALESGLSHAMANSLQQPIELTNRMESADLVSNLGFAAVQRLDARFDSTLTSNSRADTNQPPPQWTLQKIGTEIATNDSYFNDPIKTRASVPLQLNPSSITDTTDAKVSSVDTAIAGDFDFFERDTSDVNLRETSSARESAGRARHRAYPKANVKHAETANTFFAPEQDWRDLPAGMVYLRLETRSLAKSYDGKASNLGESRNGAGLGLLQWFSTYDDRSEPAVDWDQRPEIAAVEELSASPSGSNSDWMFTLLISGVLGSSRGFFIAQKEKSVQNESHGMGALRTKSKGLFKFVSN
jgi:hypothetical protein